MEDGSSVAICMPLSFTLESSMVTFTTSSSINAFAVYPSAPSDGFLTDIAARLHQ